MTDPAPTEPEPLRLERAFTADPDFASRLAFASFRYVILRPNGIIRVAAIAIAFVVAAYAGTVTSSGPAYAGRIAGIGLASFIVLIAVTASVAFLVERNRLRARIPAGSVFSVGFRTDTIVLRSPMDTTVVAYRQYVSCEEVGEFVLLRQRASRILNFLPGECFTPESLTLLREKIASPTP